MRYAEKLKSLLRQGDPEVVEMAKQVNGALTRMKAVSPGAVHNVATLSTLSVQYANEDFIGDRLLPVVNVAKKSDKYFTYTKRDRFAGPEDKVGARSTPNEINESRSTSTYSLVDYALKNFVDNETLRNQDAPLDEMMDLVEAINDVLALKREIRQASVLTTAGNYSGNTSALSGSSQWDSSAGGNPIKDLQDAKAACWMGMGAGDMVGFCSLEVWNVLSRHPAILDLFKYGGAAPGLATTRMVASFFGLSDILVGAARNDTANEGASASYSRVWGKVFGIVRVARSASLRNAAFGYTMRQNGDPITDVWFDQSIGKSGGYYARVGFSEDYKVVAGDTGFLLTSVIA